ncbi:hypothetical protein AGMMS50276_17320 [Synergistales bacterium]|nr:hypothetical protein AGMMS50276_17320 [Synergistales bacterium]
MDALKEIQNGLGMWVASGVMVLVIIVQCTLFMREALKGANVLGIPRERYMGAMRAAFFTTIGPALSPAIIMIGLVMIVGVPTAWMRLCDVGAARSELGALTIASKVIGVDPSSPDYDLVAYSYSMWGMALNNVGWMFFAVILTHRMSGIVTSLGKKYSVKRITYCTTGASVGLFAYLLANQIVVNHAVKKDVSAVAAALAMLLITYGLSKVKHLREFSLGIAMIVGMAAASLI